MTKRVLSMLMALIMALSLCVPAFAADEPVSADEPATEVEAPAAEAEEIEAEEVEAEAEPVDEPAEAAVDEPETAAVDEPLLVTLGIVTKEAHWDLKKVVDAAEKLVPDVEAGTVHPTDAAAIDFDTALEAYKKDKTDPFKDDCKGFTDALATAKEYLEGIDGKEVDLNVTTANVEKAAEDLSEYLAYDLKNQEGAHRLVKVLGSVTSADVAAYLYDTTDYRALASYKSGTPYTKATDELKINFNGKDKVTSNPYWTAAYKTSYLTKLQAAIDAVVAYKAKYAPTYSDYKTVVYAILDALALEEEGAKPVSADMTRVNAVIAATPDEDDYVKTDYILQKEPSEIYTSGLLAKVTALKADPAAATVQFASGTLLWSVNTAVAKLEAALIKPGKTTIKFLKGYGEDGAENATVTFTVDNVTGQGDKSSATGMDGYEYGIAWRVKHEGTEKWFKNGVDEGVEYKSGAAVPTDVIQKLIKGFDTEKAKEWGYDDDEHYWCVSGQVKAIGSSAKFAEGDVVTVYIFKNEGGADSAASWTQVLMKDFKIGPKSDAPETIPWPKISSVTYSAATAGEVVALSGKLYGSDGYAATSKRSNNLKNFSESAQIVVTLAEPGVDVTAGTGNAKEYDVWYEIKDANGKTIFTSEKFADGKVTSTTLQAGDEDGQFDDSLFKAGTYTVELRACKKGDMEGGISQRCAKFEFTIDPLATWEAGSSVNQPQTIELILLAAEDLVEGDFIVGKNYEGEFDATTPEGKVAQAFDLIEKNIAGIRKVLSASGAGNTVTNHNLAVKNDESNATCLDKLLTVISYLEKKDADLNDMNKQLKLAIDAIGDPSKTENEGTGKYTFDTRGRLQDAIKAAQKLQTAGATGALQSDVDAATAELKAALAGLVEIGEIDKSELEASIAAAEALNEDDYTPESWADLEDAIEAAKNVLADEDATQAQLTNAADKLNKAVAALVKRDLTTEDLEEAIAAAEAAIADPSKYTDESVLAVQDAITAAKALGDDATAAEIQEAIDKLDAAVKGLVPAEAEPELKEGWNLIEGEYYYCKDGKMVKSDWVKSKGLWYHMGADGTMDTGFIHIVDDWGDGWYYLEPSNAKGTEGRMRTGWQEINDATAGHWGWFETRSNGHQGMCTYTTNQGDYKDYKPVK